MTMNAITTVLTLVLIGITVYAIRRDRAKTPAPRPTHLTAVGGNDFQAKRIDRLEDDLIRAAEQTATYRGLVDDTRNRLIALHAEVANDPTRQTADVLHAISAIVDDIAAVVMEQAGPGGK